MSREALGARLPVSSLIDARSNMEKKYGEEERLLRARARARVQHLDDARLISGTSDNELISRVDGVLVFRFFGIPRRARV